MCRRPDFATGFDAFSLDDLFQMTLGDKKKAPGAATGAGSTRPPFPRGRKEMTIKEAWWYVPKLWCEMQCAAHGPGWPTRQDKNDDGDLVLRVYYVLGSASFVGDKLEWGTANDGPPISRYEGESNNPHEATVRSFHLGGCLPDPIEFTNVGQHKATVKVSFEAVAVCMPSMLSWVRPTGPEKLLEDQVKAYREIVAVKTVSNKSVQLVLRRPL